MVKALFDRKIRTMLPFRVLRGCGDGQVELQYEAAMDLVGAGRRTMPYIVRQCEPVIHPILRLMEMYCELEDAGAPLAAQVEKLKADLAGRELVINALERKTAELERQLRGGRTGKQDPAKGNGSHPVEK
jgi:hypothetical protein